MFDSQWLEVGIGLVLTFLVVSLAASSAVEIIARLLGKRAVDLEQAIDAMIGQAADNAAGVPQRLMETATLRSVSAVAGTTLLRNRPKRASYIPAKLFADAAAEMVLKAADAKRSLGSGASIVDALPRGLAQRLEPIVLDVGSDFNAIKAELESWFDAAMARLEGSYKRWSQLVLLLVGLAIAVGANVSAYRIAITLYNDRVVSEAVTATATRVAGDPAALTGDELAAFADDIDELGALGLPIGWDDWNSGAGTVGTVLGWGLTGLLIMLGAPFWYDLLTRLVALRSTGSKPATAPNDPASATTQRNLLLANPEAMQALSTTAGIGPEARAVASSLGWEAALERAATG